MKNGKVIGTFSALKGSSGFPRPKVEELNFIKEYGIENDKFAQIDLNKSVMVIGLIAYDIAKENDMQLKFGSFGENILLDFDPHELNIGAKIKIGDALLEVSEKCSMCNHLCIFGNSLPKLVQKHRGLYCKILKSGVISKDMKVITHA